jgi:hypothetical protein
MFTCDCCTSVAPLAGAVTTVVGGVVSVETVGSTRFGCSVCG